MPLLKEDKWLLLFGALFIAGAAYSIWIDSLIGVLIPYALLVLFVAVFYTEYTFFLIIAFTPLSVNIEEYVDGFGLFIPTEPLLAGTMLLLIIQSFYKRVFPVYLKDSPIFWAVLLYLIWIFFTSITPTR